MKIIIEYILAAHVSGVHHQVHHSSQVSNLTNLFVIKNALRASALFLMQIPKQLDRFWHFKVQQINNYFSAY